MLVRVCNCRGFLPHAMVCEISVDGVTSTLHVAPGVPTHLLAKAIHNRTKLAFCIDRDTVVYVDTELNVGKEVVDNRSDTENSVQLLDQLLER